MKNTFAVTMTLLVALTLGGSFLGFRNATHHEEAAAEGPANSGAAGVPSEEAPSAQSAATGEAGAPSAQGNVKQENQGGTQGGSNGAVAASGGAQNGGSTAQGSAATDGTNNAGTAQATTDNAAGATGQPNADKAAAQADTNAATATGDAAAGEKVFAGNCAGCHGQNAQGGIGPSLVMATEGPKAWTLAQFTTVLREGRTPNRTLGAVMPRFTAAQISDQQVADIQAYIKTLQ